MSELERLRKLEKEHEDIVQDLQDEVDELEDKVWELENDSTEHELMDKIEWLEERSIPVRILGLNDEMKLDFIKDNWEKITLENLEAIVANPI